MTLKYVTIGQVIPGAPFVYRRSELLPQSEKAAVDFVKEYPTGKAWVAEMLYEVVGETNVCIKRVE